MTRAAALLGLSQSAVSHKIRRLEQTLDCQLLARRPGAPLFTEAGRRLNDYARRLTALHDEALADLGKKPLNGAIRLGITEDTATSDIARILGRFARLYPGVGVRIRTAQSLTVQSWLASGALDLAVCQVFTSQVAPGDRRLFDDTLHWVAAADFALDPAAAVPFLSYDRNCFYRKWGLAEGQARGHRFQTVLECPSAAGIRSAVRAGLGVALLNGLHVTPDMRVIDDVFPPPPGLTFVARSPRAALPAPVAALVREIGDGLRARPPAPMAVARPMA